MRRPRQDLAVHPRGVSEDIVQDRGVLGLAGGIYVQAGLDLVVQVVEQRVDLRVRTPVRYRVTAGKGRPGGRDLRVSGDAHVHNEREHTQEFDGAQVKQEGVVATGVTTVVATAGGARPHPKVFGRGEWGLTPGTRMHANVNGTYLLAISELEFDNSAEPGPCMRCRALAKCSAIATRGCRRSTPVQRALMARRQGWGATWTKVGRSAGEALRHACMVSVNVSGADSGSSGKAGCERYSKCGVVGDDVAASPSPIPEAGSSVECRRDEGLHALQH